MRLSGATARSRPPTSSTSPGCRPASRRWEAARIAPFTLALGGLESFSSAPFLHVDGALGALAALRACLHADTPHPQGEYVPHVTVGLYADALPTATVAARFDGFAPAATLRCTIERIALMGYAAAEIGGALSTLAEWDLATHRLDWQRRVIIAALFARHARLAQAAADRQRATTRRPHEPTAPRRRQATGAPLAPPRPSRSSSPSAYSRCKASAACSRSRSASWSTAAAG